MQLDELPAQCEAEICPFRLHGRLADLPEFLEDRLLIFGRDPHPRFRHRDLHRAVHERGPHFDAAPLRGELHPVRQEVQEDLLDLARVGPDLAQAFIEVPLQREPATTRPLPHEQQGVIDRRRK
jgi:hypothetical protein